MLNTISSNILSAATQLLFNLFLKNFTLKMKRNRKGREGTYIRYIRNSLCRQWQRDDFNFDIYLRTKNVTPNIIWDNSWSN